MDEPNPANGSSPTALVEGTAADFRKHVGHAITHSKVIVIDPFGDDPIVITGSHNLSKAASG